MKKEWKIQETSTEEWKKDDLYLKKDERIGVKKNLNKQKTEINEKMNVVRRRN